jgi:hypothetical protein
MKENPKIYSFALFVIFLFSCTNASEEDLVESELLPTLVTYNNDVKVIIDNNCIVCHNNPPVNGANTSMLTYTDVKNRVQNNNLISKISGNGPGALMPLGGPQLPQSLINLIIQWEADGFVE